MMKRGKDEEKLMGPMFPRLHVNDAEKGGPRAPPRNKMALYEQLSIPSQRFSHRILPPKYNPTAKSVLYASSSQIARKETGVFFSQQLPPRHLAEQPYNQQSDLSTTVQVEWKKKLDEDDFRVPIFNHVSTSQGHGEYATDTDREKRSASHPANSNHSIKSQKTKQTSSIGHSLSQEGEGGKEVNRKEFVTGRDRLDKATSASIVKTVDPPKQTDASLCFEAKEVPADVIDRPKAGRFVQPLLCLKRLYSTGVHSNASLTEPTVAVDVENSSTKERLPSERNMVRDVRKLVDSHEDRSCRSLQQRNADTANGVCQTYTIESISEQVISPDDVVGVIGEKQFWKARRAIANQQRIFAVQVFELHRLIKVQRLIAESPHLSVEDTSYLRKPVKAPCPKKLPFDYIVKALPDVPNKGDSEKADRTVEMTTENTLGKASLSSVQNGMPPSYGRPPSENPPVPLTSNSNIGPWCFDPPPHGQQWLIPVMSPSEGLVYKPYPIPPEFVGPVYGPPVSTPVMGPAYGVPGRHHQYQLPSFPPAGPHSFFPPYMPPMVNPTLSGSSVEQLNPLAKTSRLSAEEAHFRAQHQKSAEEAHFRAQHQNSVSVPSQKSEARPDVPMLQSYKSTASSGSGRLQESGVGSTVERLNAVDDPNSGPEGEHPARAIKAVPHNARSATESAARIFRVIQEERKRQDSG